MVCISLIHEYNIVEVLMDDKLATGRKKRLCLGKDTCVTVRKEY